MNDFEQMWLVPEPVMTNKEKIILNLISLGEFFQWLVVGGLFYLFLTFVSLDLIFKSFFGTLLLGAGFIFIHLPLNGLTGLEWIQVYLRYRSEESYHHTNPSDAVGSLTLSAALEGAVLNATSLVGGEQSLSGEESEIVQIMLPLNQVLGEGKSFLEAREKLNAEAEA